MTKAVVFFSCSLLLVTSVQCSSARNKSKAQSGSTNAQSTQKVPVMDGGAGPCSVELSVLNADGKPVYAATVTVHISYGLAGIHRLDLEAGTNADGKVKFTGLPSRVHRPPLEFHATKEQMMGMATDDPALECQAKHDIVMEAPKPANQ
jgi:hypothetical protein